MSLALEISRVDNVTVVTCQGRIVFGQETTDFCRTVRDLLPQAPRVILNLHAVEYIDSGGLGSIVGLVLAARRLSGALVICDPSNRAEHLLRLTKLTSVIPVYPSQEQALAELRNSTVAA
ncbi:MAG TPA: STAS domain-containing protein [Terriglobales bacterium]|nr:STAS domain-containing protein [Terriglobales bacterium]